MTSFLKSKKILAVKGPVHDSSPWYLPPLFRNYFSWFVAYKASFFEEMVDRAGVFETQNYQVASNNRKFGLHLIRIV